MKRTLAIGAAAGSAYAALQWLGRTWGATAQERAQRLPGDEIVRRPVARTTHAITIDARPEEVWPWLVQMGYHRGGWYTYEWVDRRLFRMTNPSADRIVPELQRLDVGDIIPDGEPGTAWYEVVEIDPPHTLVLHSTTHLPPTWRRNPQSRAWVDWTWVFVLEQQGPTTRLLLRMRGACGPWWLRVAFVGAIVPADFVMARSMLTGIRSRVQATDRGTSPVGMGS
ncbi:MAG: hypothetical protein ACXWB2_05200 [Acidimicrobiales bacterium]